MGFNISQIINKSLKKDNPNPYQTKHGVSEVSVSESFEAYLFRVGRMLNIGSSGTAITSGVDTLFLQMYCSYGCSTFPSAIMVAGDVDMSVTIEYNSNLPFTGGRQDGRFWEYSYLKAGTPLIRKLNGEIKINDGGWIKVTVKPTTTGKAYGSVTALEVQSND